MKLIPYPPNNIMKPRNHAKLFPLISKTQNKTTNWSLSKYLSQPSFYRYETFPFPNFSYVSQKGDDRP